MLLLFGIRIYGINMNNKIIKLQEYLKDKGFEKEAMLLSAIAFLNLFGCAGQEYTMENVSDENLDGMRIPDCVGNVFLPYNPEDFADLGIPLEEFRSQHETLHKVDVEVHDEQRARTGSDISEYGVDRYCVVIYRNMPVNHPSFESSGIKRFFWPSWRDNWVDNTGGGNLYIRDFYLYYPILSVNGKDMAFFNRNHVKHHVSGEDRFSSWMSKCPGHIMFGPYGDDREDSQCRKLIKEYIERSPLRDPEAEY